MADKKASITDLETWFSVPRLHKYRAYAEPELVYCWNALITKELLVDIGHLEVLLRNALDLALCQETAYGKLWFYNPKLPMSIQAKKSIDKAVERATKRGTRQLEAGRVIAELPFDFWRYLFSKYYQATVWPKFSATLRSEVSRKDFERHLNFIYLNRNRFSHHEPLIKGSKSQDIEYALKIRSSVEWLAFLISEEASLWILQNSFVADRTQQHPVTNNGSN